MSIKSNQFMLKAVGGSLLTIIILVIIVKLLSPNKIVTQVANTATTTPKRLNDNTTGDTANETLQTLIAENSQLKNSLAQQKADMNQLRNNTDTSLQTTQSDLKQQVNSIQNQMAAMSDKVSGFISTHANHANTTAPVKPADGFVWVADANASTSVTTNEMNDTHDNPVSTDVTQNNSTSPMAKTSTSGFSLPSNPLNKTDDKPAPKPYMTIPENATLTDAIALQPLIGRIPRNGVVVNPRSFKFMVEANNFAANGINIPPELKGAVGRARCEGDLLSSSVTCDVVSLTFVFQDGRIATISSTGDNDSLGTVSDEYGDPLIQGKLVSDAGLYLAGIAATSGVQAYGNALSAAQTATTTQLGGTGVGSISQLIGNSKIYAEGQALSGAAQATQQWWNQRVQSSYDYVYVPNFTDNKLLHVNLNITKPLAIDYDQLARKVSYSDSPLANIAKQLD